MVTIMQYIQYTCYQSIYPPLLHKMVLVNHSTNSPSDILNVEEFNPLENSTADICSDSSPLLSIIHIVLESHLIPKIQPHSVAALLQSAHYIFKNSLVTISRFYYIQSLLENLKISQKMLLVYYKNAKFWATLVIHYVWYRA